MEVTEFYAKNRAAWRGWLQRNHDTQQAVWLIYDKGAHRTLSWEDIVQEALCFGWIDSKPGKVSETQSKLYVSRRKSKSVWSKNNFEGFSLSVQKNILQWIYAAKTEPTLQKRINETVELAAQGIKANQYKPKMV
jgi:uncharacterized protein YdeI (YjbR/CyaY-like superfamily)